MDIKDLSTYLGNHCRFKFRNGKDVYGVIWESNAKYFFSSKERHDLLKKKELDHIIDGLLDNFDQIDPHEIVRAERIAG